jgi:ankyrin repeat protein
MQMQLVQQQSISLVEAARQGNTEEVESLLASGHCIDKANEDGVTACHAVVVSNIKTSAAVAVLNVLLARRPNLGQRDCRGRIPLSYALARKNSCIVTMLLKAGSPFDHSNMHMMCVLCAQSTDVVQALLDRGVVMRELCDALGKTPFHFAPYDFNRDAMDMLLAAGADLNARSSSDEAPIHVIARVGHESAMRWLIEAGADLDCGNSLGQTPLHEACFPRHSLSESEENARCAMLLLAAGADVHARTTDGRSATALHRIAEFVKPYRMTIIHVLLSSGADLDATNHIGGTARQFLANRGVNVDPAAVAAARREIVKLRLDFVRHRALNVCIGLQSMELDALRMCEIMLHACGRVAPLIAFHHWWTIATTVKHFKSD